MQVTSDISRLPTIALLSAGATTDYRYVFGAHRGAERHDPHERNQRAPADLDLGRVAELLRGPAKEAQQPA